MYWIFAIALCILRRHLPSLFLVQKGMETAQYLQIYRSREVGQSYITSVWTTLIAIAYALWLMIKIRPQVVCIYIPTPIFAFIHSLRCE